jgi:hypothetical protein
VIAVWCSDPDFVDDEGRPLPLPRTAPAGEPSLERLVGMVSQDVHPRSLLEEWLRLGVAMIDVDGIKLKQPGFVASEGYDEKAYYFGDNLRDHIAAGTHNLAGREPAFLDRTVTYDGLSQRSVDELRELCKRDGEALLLKINRRARELAKRDRPSSQEKGRMTFGAYFFSESEATSEERKPEWLGGS